ncbi:MAG: nucleotidyltransferase domain-containing protein [Leptolyngbya sp. RL_3_1]|nr:nucleotidyltransferase domain-containing protein [Leptolyngbya sp. RL_3_1]
MSLPSATPTTIPTSPEQRRQAAWAIAEQCTQLLQQGFGATEVIVFGSLRGDTPWHNDSDLDLAVRGLPPETLLKAYQQLETLVPSWLPFDLVALEQAGDRIRDRILQNPPMPQNPLLALKIHLEDELSAMAQTIQTLATLVAQADTIPEIALIPAAAGYIEDFYSGCERLAERVAIALDGGLPQGRNWHEQLLQQMAAPGGQTGSQQRPPLWNSTLLKELETYRRFRHRARHLYSVNLDGGRVLDLAQQVPMVFDQVHQAISVFGNWLVQQAS